MVERVTYRRRHSYNTRSNKVKKIRTPGGHLRVLHLKKRAAVPKCGDCGHALQGIPALRPRQYSAVSKRVKTVQRAYGGSRCADCVRHRILRAFLIEEHKVVKRVLKSKKALLPKLAAAAAATTASDAISEKKSSDKAKGKLSSTSVKSDKVKSPSKNVASTSIKKQSSK